jgi:hypothetical protein
VEGCDDGQHYWALGLSPSSGMKTQHFDRLELFPSSGEGRRHLLCWSP